MGITVGDIVACHAGREKGRFLVVVAVEEGFVHLADGKERKLLSPKRKNVKHVSLTTHALAVEQRATDKQLRMNLRKLGFVQQLEVD